MNTESSLPRNLPLGVAGMVTSAVFFALMAGLLRTAPQIDFYTAALFRFTIGIALLGTAAMTGLIRLTFVRRRLLFLRGLLGGAGTVLFYMAIMKVGLAKGTAITYTFPIFAAVGGALFLREKIRLSKWVAIMLAMAGIYMTVCGFGPLSKGFGPYECLAVFGAVLAGAVVVMIKELRETESTHAIFCAQCAVGFWLVLLPSNASHSDVSMSAGTVMVASALLAAGGQLLMTYSYRHLPVSTGSLLSMLTPVLNVGIGLLFFGEDLAWDSAIGVGVVLASCTYVVVRREG